MIERKEAVTPFAMRFQERISNEDVVQVKGEYNEKTQMWEWPIQPDGSSIVMSSPQTEHPPTICNLATRVGNRIALDPVIDD